MTPTPPAAGPAPGAKEQLRVTSLMSVMPAGRATALEIGARGGFVTRHLAGRFASVTALDLRKPAFEMERVTPVQGDVRRLQFPDASFDCVVCTEVLEHVPEVELAAREIARVACHEIVIGVPFRQDTRVGRSICRHCCGINPPNGHVHRFDEERLRRLFPGWTAVSVTYVGSERERTSSLADWFQRRAGYPYGSYAQEEPCIHCGQRLVPPPAPTLAGRICAAIGLRLDLLQRAFLVPRPTWIHMVFRR